MANARNAIGSVGCRVRTGRRARRRKLDGLGFGSWSVGVGWLALRGVTATGHICLLSDTSRGDVSTDQLTHER